MDKKEWVVLMTLLIRHFKGTVSTLEKMLETLKKESEHGKT
jgi:uncharacterized alpha/beta hydrolase family protein